MELREKILLGALVVIFCSQIVMQILACIRPRKALNVTLLASEVACCLSAFSAAWYYDRVLNSWSYVKHSFYAMFIAFAYIGLFFLSVVISLLAQNRNQQ